MPNGSDDRINVLNSSISDQQKSIATGLRSTTAQANRNSFPTDTDTANTMDQSLWQISLLSYVFSEIFEHEKVIWGDDTGNNSTYDSYHSRNPTRCKEGETLKFMRPRRLKEQEQKIRIRSPKKTAKSNGYNFQAVLAPTGVDGGYHPERRARSFGALVVS